MTLKSKITPHRGGPRVVGYVQHQTDALMDGCDLYRIILPLVTLKQQGYPVEWSNNINRIADNGDKWDILVLTRLYTLVPEIRAKLFPMMKAAGKKIVLDIDDDLWELPPWNRYQVTDIDGLSDMVSQVDMVTVSTQPLFDRIKMLNPNVRLLPNAIAPSMWGFNRKEARFVDGLTVGVHGGDSHSRDWAVLVELFTDLALSFPELKFVVSGYNPPELDVLDVPGFADRYTKLPWASIREFPVLVGQVDIGLCPLSDDAFNRSKSALKWMEYGALGIPAVCSPVVYPTVVRHGYNGYIARTPDEWYEYVSDLVKSASLRNRIGQQARREVYQQCNMNARALLWYIAYRKLWGAQK